MAIRMFDPAFETSINQRFRERRFGFFLSLLKRVRSTKPIRILDVGGTEVFWKRMKFSHRDVHITLLNREKEPVKSERFSCLQGDACDLSVFNDKEYEVVFSNSVIEHLCATENQVKMAREVRRVGKNYFVQTPNYYFPLEPHWMFPFFQFLPLSARVSLTMNLNLGHYNKATSVEEAYSRVNEVKLLTENKMKAVFPDGKVYREKFFGMVKSITMYRFPEA